MLGDPRSAVGTWMRTCILASILLSPCAVIAQNVGTVSVTAGGFGQTEAEAVSDAVINGIAQVNGESVASSMRVRKTVTSSTEGGTQASRTIDKDLSRRTQGIVKSWRKISSEPSGTGSYSATVSVDVFVLKKAEQLKRTKLAIVPPSVQPDELTAALVAGLTQNLTSSRKFAVMDRRNNAAVSAQLNQIRKGGSLEDKVRMNAEVAPDYIAVASVETQESVRGKVYAIASLEIIDYATRQIKFSEKKRLPLSTPGDPSSDSRRISMLSKGLSRMVLQTVYPPIVVGADDGFITIAQGSDFFNMGDKLVIKQMGQSLRDPHTREFLGYDQKDIGQAEITFVDKRIAKARLTQQLTLTDKGIANKQYQVWRTGDAPSSDFFSTLTMGADTKEGKPGKLFATDGGKDEEENDE